ncbi:I78 family peptidase inhibitor [Sphingopyxis sp.]|uniref:I78 family peptidase inhibitor n=1 Tax=Sphingopyxis sp. TaxID=1908224 RepID=UPI00345AEA9A
MMDIRLLAIAAVLPLAACTQERPPASTPTPPTEAMCNADGVQSFVGQTATGEVGAQLIKGSGATTLRWVPPRTAVTMDFRPDRLTVSYDDALKIERISCG